MTAALAQVHKAVAAAADAEDDDDALDLDPALAACVQLALAGPHDAGRGRRDRPARRSPSA
ncbi:MAG: hypothetical protein IPK80_01205 [Nannocystis sp.]|nr:hypothetical protein [Nannocystis sp.]